VCSIGLHVGTVTRSNGCVRVFVCVCAGARVRVMKWGVEIALNSACTWSVSLLITLNQLIGFHETPGCHTIDGCL
jgi:hypothetical protein